MTVKKVKENRKARRAKQKAKPRTSKKEKAAQQKNQTRTPVQSTQQNVAVKDITNNGIIITREEEQSYYGSVMLNRFVKIIEVKPSPYFKKTIEERNKIAGQFESSLKSAPDNLHIKIMTIPADLSDQITNAEENIKKEKVGNCVQMGYEYIQHLEETEETGLTHRYFISFEYKAQKALEGQEKLNDINYQLLRYKQLLVSGLARCGNEVVYPDQGETEKTYLERTLYGYFNRDKTTKSDFNARYNAIYERYKDNIKEGQTEPYIPPSDVIAPNKISYIDKKFMMVNDTYYAFLYIPSNGYNPYVIDGWLQLFTTVDSGIDVDVFLQKEDRDRKIRDLRRTIGHSLVDMNDSNSISSGGEMAQAKYQSGQYLLQSLQSGYDFYNAETIITVTGSTPKEVEMKIDMLKSIGRENDITLKDIWFQQEAVFKSVALTGKLSKDLQKKLGRNMTTQGASSMYSFTTAELIHKKGIYIADDLETQSPVIPDFWNRAQFVNPHIFVCGETGVGKTASIMQIAIRARLKHIPVFMMAPEKQGEFERLCKELGGQFVNISPSADVSGARLNIFDIFPKVEYEKVETHSLLDEEEYKGTGEEDNQVMDKISSLYTFFDIFLGNKTTQKQADIINEALIKVYQKKGISTEDENSLWLDKRTRTYKEMPIMADFVDTLFHDFDGTELEKEAHFLGSAFRPLTRGQGAFFNGKTNIDTDNEFFVFGLENVGETYTGLAMYMVMEYVWSRVKAIKGQKVIMIDEWWKMANNRLAAERTMKIAKLARSLGGSLIIATQQMTDILSTDEGGKLGKDVLNNCATKIIMHLQKDDLKAVANIVHLTQSEMDDIDKFGAGQALFINNDLRISLKFNPTETEKLFTFNDAETLKYYDEFVRKRHDEENYRKKMANPENANSLFDDSDIEVNRASDIFDTSELNLKNLQKSEPDFEGIDAEKSRNEHSHFFGNESKG